MSGAIRYRESIAKKQEKGARRKEKIINNYGLRITDCGSITQYPELKTQNPERKTQNAKLKTQNPEPKTQNPEPRTQNPEPLYSPIHPGINLVETAAVAGTVDVPVHFRSIGVAVAKVQTGGV